LREFRFNSHSSGRDSISSIHANFRVFNLERGEGEEEGSEEVISIVCCKGFKH
jgi:hypothetical protein